MFSGAKHKLQRWRQRKSSAKVMIESSTEGFGKKVVETAQQFSNLNFETGSVIEQLNRQVSALNEIGEDTTVVAEKITLLTENAKIIEKGQQDSKAFASLFEYVESVNDEIKNENAEIADLRRQANSLFNENKKLRTELQIFQDHYERSELRAVELEIQVEHFKFMASLPLYVPFFEAEENKEMTEEDEKFAVMPKVAIPFLEHHFPAGTGCYILSALDEMDLQDNSRLQILLDLIKSYIKGEAYDIAIPLLKTTVEDLLSKHSSHEKTVFKVMEMLAIVYNVTQRLTDAVQVEKEILEIRKECMLEDEKGLAQTLSTLAVLCGKVGQKKTARNFCRQALDLKTKIYGDCDPETAKEFHNMGLLYFIDGKYTKATDYLLSALTTPNQNAFCLANLDQKEQCNEEKCIFYSTLKFLHNELEKLLEGEKTQMEEILADETKLEYFSECKNMNRIQKLLHLLSESNLHPT